MHNSDPPPQGVENRNIILWFKCVLTSLHVNCIILFDKEDMLDCAKKISTPFGSNYFTSF
jgi:hypothetical protein